MPKKEVVCDTCGAVYRDYESIELVEKWAADGYAPCPNIWCRGQLLIREIHEDAETPCARPQERGDSPHAQEKGV